jgi:AraC-like DNA-binding protein/tetratricopeptide (TPR) repeat protein
MAQQFTTVPDSLKKYSYLELADKVVTNMTKDPLINKKNYIYAYSDLLKAIKENNSEEIFYGYLLMSSAIPDFKLAMKYSDSACSMTHAKMKNLISRAFYEKGYLYYRKKRLKEALNCFLIASNDSINPSKYLQNRISYAIGMIKNTQGDYPEALAIYKKCEATARINKLPNYLVYLFGLAEVYNRTNNISLSEKYTNTGINLRTKDDSGELYYPYFIANQGKNEYKRKHYNKAITDLNSSIAIFKKSDDYSNHAENSFFIGECYREQHLDEKAMQYYKKVDSVFTAKNDIYPIIIPAYEHLIAYYKKKQDYQQVIFYSDQFIKADKVMNDNYKYIASKIAKTYDIQKVIAGKQAIISELNSDKKMSTYTIITLIGLLLLTILFLYNYSKKKQKELFFAYKAKEEKVKKEKETEKVQSIENSKKIKTTDIDEKIITNILESLQRFEKELQFLKKEYNKDLLATECNTNSSYLSRVLNDIKCTTFTLYINSLRIEYIIKKLETEKIYLEYTIQYLSEISGFNSVETFARAFKEHTKMNPSKFIKQLIINDLCK